MKKIMLALCFSLFFYVFLFSAYDENKFMQAGKALLAKGQYDKAIKVFNFIIKKNPKNVNAIVYGAFAHFKKGNKAIAKRYLEAAYKMTKDPKIKKMIVALAGQQPASTEQKKLPGKETFKPFHFGLKAGLNLANITGADVPSDAKMLMGVCGGGFISYAFTPWLSLQPEILYSLKGYTQERYIQEGVYTYEYKQFVNFNYIEIPVLVKLSIPTGSAFTPVIYAGPAISIKAGATEFSEITLNGETTRASEDISESISSMDFNLVAGAGIEIKAGSGAITVDVRYDMGFTTVKNIEGLDPMPEVKTTAITLLAGYSF